MSIKVMTWAFGLPLEPRAKIALLAIADNARDDGVAWPSRDNVAEKSSQSRATVNRRLKILEQLGVIEIRQRFREDGTQTTDEIRCELSIDADEVKRRMKDSPDKDASNPDDDADSTPENEAGGGCQTATLPVQSGHPGVSDVTGGGSHCGNPQDEPSLEQDSPPSPPAGGPLSKAERESLAKRETLWTEFRSGYPNIAAMDQQAARDEFNRLTLDDAAWAAGVTGAYAAECKKAGRPPKNAHLWLRKGMFRNFPKPGEGGAVPPAPDRFAVDSPEGRAVQVMNAACGGGSLLVIAGHVRYAPGVDAQVFAFADAPERSKWRWTEDAEQIGAWRRFAASRAASANRRDIVETRRIGSDEHRGAWLPWPWPPAKDGLIYDWPVEGVEQSRPPDEGEAA